MDSGDNESFRDLKHSDSEIKSVLIKQYSLTEDEINNFLQNFIMVLVI